jgi:glycosyltransferase involved in cell wall biosynthesis
MSETVSVIIPAYNAAATIDETLMSVRSQSWRELEIIVVDDGSTDDTGKRVVRHMAEDARVRLIQQPNGGVAVARNRGIAEASADLIAPVDADDLWRPTKIEKQLSRLCRAGEAVALVYTWFATIDEQGRIIAQDNSSDEEGDVLRRMCKGNLVGNGSSPLMRKTAVLEAGGYDPGLRAQRAQGCEDLKLYFAIAERHRFAVVREHLTGYRWTPENMSSDGRKMLRSYDLVMTPLRAKYPQYRAEFEWGRAFLIGWLFDRAVRYGGFAQCWALYRELLSQHALMACHRAVRLADILLRYRWLARDAVRLPFLEGRPAT